MSDNKPKSLGEVFAEFRQIAAEENYEFPEVPRSDRPNAFVEMLDDEFEEQADKSSSPLC